MPKIDSHNIRISASTEELSRVREFIADISGQHGLSGKVTYEIQMAVDEACTNVIKHAYEFDDSRSLKVSAEYTDDQLIIRIFDNGKSFDPEDYTAPDLANRIKNKKRGGFGIYLMRSFMDEVAYSNNNGYNELRMVRNL